MIFNVNSGKGKDENLLPENIKNGVVIDDVVGTYSGEVFSAIMSFSNATSIDIPHTMGRTPTSLHIVQQSNTKGKNYVYSMTYAPAFTTANITFIYGTSSSAVSAGYLNTQNIPITMSETSVSVSFGNTSYVLNGTFKIILL